MKAAARVRGKVEKWPLTVKDISSTGMKAATPISLFLGTQVEIELPNVGWIPGQVVRIEENTIGIQFGCVIDPDVTQVRIGGSYGPPPSGTPQFRYV
jgi:hypothetical protein